MTTLGTKRPREDEHDTEISRPRKRPGGAARVARADAEAVIQRQQQRAEEAKQAAASRGVEEVVRQHYNAVPQRGREWRKTDSRIKGLRSFNNWVKSTMIHKFSPSESGGDFPLRVLDIGCGKGGDLGKWQQAPQPLELYVGIDPAEVSIEQARERYAQMRSGGRGGRGGRGGYRGDRSQRTFDAEFFVEDAFTYSLSDIQLIRDVGFGPGSRWGPGGGFDVVSMMFCMHYAFENEVKAKGMLANVAGSLRKGGRFIGVIPNSDVIRQAVEAFHKRQEAQGKETSTLHAKPIEQLKGDGSVSPPYLIGDKDSPPPSKRKASSTSDDERPVKKRKDSTSQDNAPGTTPVTNILTEPPSESVGNLNGEKSSNGAPGTDNKPTNETSPQNKDTKENPPATDRDPTPPREAQPHDPPVAEWGNTIYRVRFPGDTPKDGIFRPPYGWKYSFFMEEAVEEVPEYVVPWEAFRAIAEYYNLELQYRKSFADVWKEEKNHPVFGPLSERMGVRGRDAGPLLVSEEEMEAAGFYHAFCFYKI